MSDAHPSKGHTAVRCRKALYRCASFQVLPYLDCVFVEGALDLLVEGFVLVVDEVHVIAAGGERMQLLLDID